MIDKQNIQAEHERRQRFRIADTAILEIERVTQEQADSVPAEAFFKPSAAFTLMRELKEIDAENQATLRAISDRYSDIAVYLNSINRKIDVIGASVAENILPEAQKLQAIDLSEGGIGFNHDRKMEPGQYYAMKVWFHRALLGVSVFIQVVGCSRAIDGGLHISASFYQLPDNERKTIARHIMMVQAEMQRSKKAQSGDQVGD